MISKCAPLKPGSQYIVSVSSQPEAINFSMGIDVTKRWNRIGFYSSVSPIEKLMASGCDETEMIYCEPALMLVFKIIKLNATSKNKKKTHDTNYFVSS